MTDRVCVTVDFEPDCPPYLQTSFRGITEGAPPLLELLQTCGVPATFFTTSQVAAQYPDAVRQVVNEGHELGCHGVSHTPFDCMNGAVAQCEIVESSRVLRTFAPVSSFRAPYLRFPDEFLPLLEASAFTLDSSQARYKRSYYASHAETSLTRVPASVTSSVLRLPAVVRNAWLGALSSPVVLFVHPWEFVDLRSLKLRYDCRFRTGAQALQSLREVVAFFQQRRATFVRMRELVTTAPPPGPGTASRQ